MLHCNPHLVNDGFHGNLLRRAAGAIQRMVPLPAHLTITILHRVIRGLLVTRSGRKAEREGIRLDQPYSDPASRTDRPRLQTLTYQETTMIGYVTLGTNDLPRAAAFYDTLLAQLGAKRLWESAQGVAWGVAWDKPSLGVMTPHDKQPATRGNGTMVALVVQEPAQVDALYGKAIELGATDEGPAGPRGTGFYAGYFRDLDGNKLNVFCMPKSEA
jgi:catechol 2,3-dioxygenase-like lactoylglutathione lyase family enzyme